MKAIDIHAHYAPLVVQTAVQRGESWHGIKPGTPEGNTALGKGSSPITQARFDWDIEQRVQEMDSQGIDMHVLSTFTGYYKFDSDSEASAACEEVNDEMARIVKERPSRFAAFSTLPAQNIKAAIAELERATRKLGMKGAMVNDTFFGKNFDEPELFPFWQAAERLGAIIFVHQGGPTIVSNRINRYYLGNSIGNLVERTITFATLVFGGVMDKCPDLKVLLAHSGGYTCFGIGRMDHTWKVRPESRHIPRPPSAYLNRFYYDCLTQNEHALRFLIDSVGPDRVLLGTDWPAEMALEWPVSWIMGLKSLTKEEKESVLSKNAEHLLGLKRG